MAAHESPRSGRADPPPIPASWLPDEPANVPEEFDEASRFRRVVMALCALFGLWLVSKHTLVAYLAEAAPDAALHLSSADSVALTRSAAQGLALLTASERKGSQTSGDLAGVADKLKAAIAQDPLSAEAFRILGQVAELQGEPARSIEFNEAALSRSLHEQGAVRLKLLHSIKESKWGDAITYIDVLLRTNPDMIASLMPMLTAMVEAPETAPLMRKLVNNEPPWWRTFNSMLPQYASDPRTTLLLFMDRKAAGHPPSTMEFRQYVEGLLRKDMPALAYYAWLQSLPPDELSRIGFMFNGGFELPLSGMPFDWTIKPSVGAIVGILPEAANPSNRALSIEFVSGRVVFGEVTQQVMLPPGKYSLGGRFQGRISGRRGLKWIVQCQGPGAQVVFDGPMFVGTQVAWADFEHSFEVPEVNCPWLILRLSQDARHSAEQFLTGEIRYDDLKINRTGAQ